MDDLTWWWWAILIFCGLLNIGTTIYIHCKPRLEYIIAPSYTVTVRHDPEVIPVSEHYRQRLIDCWIEILKGVLDKYTGTRLGCDLPLDSNSIDDWPVWTDLRDHLSSSLLTAAVVKSVPLDEMIRQLTADGDGSLWSTLHSHLNPPLDDDTSPPDVKERQVNVIMWLLTLPMRWIHRVFDPSLRCLDLMQWHCRAIICCAHIMSGSFGYVDHILSKDGPTSIRVITDHLKQENERFISRFQQTWSATSDSHHRGLASEMEQEWCALLEDTRMELLKVSGQDLQQVVHYWFSPPEQLTEEISILFYYLPAHFLHHFAS